MKKVISSNEAQLRARRVWAIRPCEISHKSKKNYSRKNHSWKNTED